MLRRGEDPKVALGYAQHHLGPLALESSPEAYAEFKNCLLMVMYKEGDSIPSLVAEWRVGNREVLASSLHATLLSALGVQETLFPLLLRYLITVHNIFHVMNGVTPVFGEIEQLVLPDKLPAPTSRQPPNGPLATNDVQALQQTLSISQQDAVNALRFSNNNLEAALKNELSRIQLNRDMLIHMIMEYESCSFVLAFCFLLLNISPSPQLLRAQGNHWTRQASAGRALCIRENIAAQAGQGGAYGRPGDPWCCGRHLGAVPTLLTAAANHVFPAEAI